MVYFFWAGVIFDIENVKFWPILAHYDQLCISPINAQGKLAKCTKCRIYMRMPKTLTILTVVDPHLQDSRETEAREGASDTWVLRLTEPGTPPPSCRGNPVHPQYPVLDKAHRISIRRVIWILTSDTDTIYTQYKHWGALLTLQYLHLLTC